MARPATRIALAIGTFGATEALGDLGDAVVEATSGEVAQASKEFWQKAVGRQAAMDEFGAALQALVQDSISDDEETKRIVIVIDELDRCRPDYALEVLEVIKHLFSVPGVHFILGVNLDALGKSVEARYGSGVDSESYLRKFISLQLALPVHLGDVYRARPASLVYLDHQLEELEIPQHLVKPIVGHLELVGRSADISIRDINRILSSIALLNAIAQENDRLLPGWVEVLVTLVVAKVVRPELYESFRDSNISSEEILSYFGASNSEIEEMVNGEGNPDYNHGVFWRYWSWIYLTGSSRTKEIDRETLKAVARQFDNFGESREARLIPKKVDRDWMDWFSFSESGQ